MNFHALFEELLCGRRVEQNTEILKRLGGSLTHAILPYLEQAGYGPRSIALYCLQYCWSRTALERVKPMLRDADPRIRRMAAIVIGKGEGVRALAALCVPLLEHREQAVRIFALEYAEMFFPDPERTLRLAADRDCLRVLARFLCRYHTPRLHAVTRRLLDDADPAIVRHGLIALAYQADAGASTRARAGELLTHVDSRVRDAAADYLCWHGGSGELPALERAAAAERDPHALAGMRAAMAAVDRRRAAPPARVRAAARALSDFDRRRPLEPHLEYTGREPAAGLARRCRERMDLLAGRYAMPCRVTGAGEAVAGGGEAPPADGFLEPISGYRDPGRTSFGKQMGTDAPGFTSMVHVGDDAGWELAGATVVSPASGVVRQVSCSSTWGCMVVIEHRLLRAGDGSTETHVCTVFAHLGPFIHVRPGEVVERGQKLGGIGRGFTFENGGYPAHLHFAVHRGPYVQVPAPGDAVDLRYRGRLYRGLVKRADAHTTWARISTRLGSVLVRKPTSWLSGYISRSAWRAKDHGWVDPQELGLWTGRESISKRGSRHGCREG